MLELERIEDKVYHNGVELKINAQASKGPGKEVVWVGDLVEANGQKWVSLSKLQQGINQLECKPREHTTHKKYELTKEEQDKVNELQSQIDAIIENAKSRYVEPINLNKIDPSKLTQEEKLDLIERLQNMILSK